MGGKNREIYSVVYSQEEITNGQIKRKSGYKSVGIRKKIGGRKRGTAGQVMLRGHKRQS